MNRKRGAGAVLTAMFAALISVACFFHIPLPGMVPIVLQDALAHLSGMLLGPVYGTCAVLVFLALGSIGLPVFSGKAGINVILNGPTGGFLVGYLLGAAAAGLFLQLALNPKKEHGRAKQWICLAVASLLATLALFSCGIFGFMRATGKDFAATAAACVLPFIPGNIVKQVLNVLLAKKFRPVVANYIYG